jgi:hypothetical protein
LGDSEVSQKHLFDEPARDRNRELDRVADQITEKFGKQALRRGAVWKRKEEHGDG